MMFVTRSKVIIINKIVIIVTETDRIELESAG